MTGKYAEFVKGAASVIPDKVNEWECVFDPAATASMVATFYFLDAHDQISLHAVAPEEELLACDDAFALGAQKAKKALAAAMGSGFFNKAPNYVVDGVPYTVSGQRLGEWKAAA